MVFVKNINCMCAFVNRFYLLFFTSVCVRGVCFKKLKNSALNTYKLDVGECKKLCTCTGLLFLERGTIYYRIRLSFLLVHIL